MIRIIKADGERQMKCEVCKNDIELACGQGLVVEEPCGSCEPKGETRYWHTFCHAKRYYLAKEEELIELRAVKKCYERIIKESIK